MSLRLHNLLRPVTSVLGFLTVSAVCMAATIPGKVEAESYASMVGVQNEACAEGGQNVGWIDGGDSMTYSITVPATGSYTLQYRVASVYATGVLQTSYNGANLGTVAIPNTGGWQTWTTVSQTVNLSAGTANFVITVPTGGWNLNWINFIQNVTGVTVPAQIEAESWTSMVGVQTEACGEGGSNVGWIDGGDSLTYAINVPSAGSYKIEYRVASPNATGVLGASFNGASLGNVAIPSTGGWQTWTTVSQTVNLAAGSGNFVITVPTGGWNLNWIKFSAGTPVTVTITTQPASRSVSVGQTATFTVAATTNSGTLSYQWYKNSAAINGATAASYTTPAATTADNGAVFYVKVSSGTTSVNSSNATLTVGSNGVTVPAQIEAESYATMTGVQTETCGEGGQNVGWIDANDSMTFPITVPTTGSYLIEYRVASPNGTGSLRSTWNGAVLPTLTVPNTGGWQTWTTISQTVTLNAGSGNFVISAPAGGWNFNWFKISTGTPVTITITSHPASQTVSAGQTATFTVTASASSGTLGYQWYKNGAALSGATAASYTTPATTTTDSGSTYYVRLSAGSTAINSNSATLTVNPTDGLLWSDEFNGATIDSNKWAFDIGTGPNGDGWGNGEWEYYTNAPENAAIENGNLVITLKNDSLGGRPFSSSRLVSRGKYSFKHGRIVARIKMPYGNMVWPAFWLLGDHSNGWPQCGEIDIAEMFCGATGVGDNSVFSTCHWFHDLPAPGGYANYGQTFTNGARLADAYHEYELNWDDTQVSAKFDGQQYYTMTITDPSLNELKDNFFYFILNVAAGKPQFAMTSPDQIGALPQKMYIDWIRVYQNGTAEVLDKKASQPTGTLGILADGTATNSKFTLGVDSNLFLWNNLTSVTATPAAGATSLALRTNDTSWFGMGIASTTRKNLMNYAAGYLNFRMKTSSTDTFQIGVGGGNNGNSWVTFTNGADPYGFARDNQWHTLSIPMTALGSADFTDITQFFMLVSSGTVTAGRTYEFDEIYWSPNAAANLVTPNGNMFGIFTDRACDAGKFTPTGDGAIYVWNTANNQVLGSVPFEGANSFSFSAPLVQWYGLGFTPTRLYNLSAFANGFLHIALKVPASTTGDFKIGLKSPGGTAVRESWINFQNGADPYGFVRDGRYHELRIPASAFNNSDLSAVAQLLMITGDGAAQMEFDDVYWTKN